MRTNIVLDDDLVKEAFRHAPVKTKRELVDLALREFVGAQTPRPARAVRPRRDPRRLRLQGAAGRPLIVDPDRHVGLD